MALLAWAGGLELLLPGQVCPAVVRLPELPRLAQPGVHGISVDADTGDASAPLASLRGDPDWDCIVLSRHLVARHQQHHEPGLAIDRL
ncbi:hypothetical protein D3C78_1389300 [compost metagenome]